MYHRGRVFQSCGFAPPAERERKTIGLFISQEDVGRLLAHVSNNCETPLVFNDLESVTMTRERAGGERSCP